METLLNDKRTLGTLDHSRLARLIRDLDATDDRHGVANTLSGAELISTHDIPPDVVTMDSRVLVEDLGTGRRHVWTLCYPADADPARGLVSVLSAVGASLLGRRVGTVAHWREPNGDERSVEVIGLVFQPEDDGA
jgi:regulator of nucleoside diphosphate kinase